MLTSLQAVKTVPQLKNQGDPYLTMLIEMADAEIKRYTKQGLEQTAYTEFYSGNNRQDLVLRQKPVIAADTTITVASNGAALPQATLNVASTVNFPSSGTLTVQVGVSSWAAVSYTGTTSITFTGCAGGAGTLATSYRVAMPTLWWDATGYNGLGPSAFADSGLMFPGVHYTVVRDSGGTKSNSGLLRKVGGSGAWWPGYYPENIMSGKLAARRLPIWSLGDGNYKVAYTAGFYPVPKDLEAACIMLVASLARTIPLGAAVQSESLGGYSYSLASPSPGGVPDLTVIARMVSQYRDSSWGV